MYKEKLLVDRLKEILDSGENICYFGIDLITDDYDPVRLAELAKKEGLTQRLGYLAEVCAQASEVTHIPEEDKLRRLYRTLENSFEGWQHLEPNLPEWGKRIDIKLNGRENLNKKWKIYSPLRLEEIEDWIDLYVTKDFLHFTPYERCQMNMKGVKYTRLMRS